jgi:para-aminobenzoate synthetase/4-amino-4-deoxychorismate lyase
MPAEHKVLIRDAARSCWLGFSHPRHIFCAQKPEDIIPILAEIEHNVSRHQLWAAGWIGYEAAGVFDPALVTHEPTEVPALWFGLFERCQPVSVESMLKPEHVNVFQQTVWSLNSDLDQYSEKIDQIKTQIRNGNTYQVNYTIRQFADLDISVEDAFLGFASNARYGAFIDTGRFAVC